MPLPHIVKFVYNHGTEEVIRRGKKIHAFGYVELVEHDDLMHTIVLRVRDDSYSTFYKVHIQKYKDPQGMNVRCSCPYNLGDICRHEVAALLQLQDFIDRNVLGYQHTQYNQRHTVVKMRNIELKHIRTLSAPFALQQAEKFLRSNKATIISAKEECVKASLTIEGSTFSVTIQKNEERNFDTSCNCAESTHLVCTHKAILFIQLLNAYGPQYFDSIRNLDKEKSKLLSIYGYTLTDPWQEKFEFIYKEGKPFLRVLDQSVKRVEPQPRSNKQVAAVAADVLEEEQPVKSSTRLGVVFNANHKAFPGFVLDLVRGEADEATDSFIGNVEKLDINKYIDTEKLSSSEKQALALLRRLQPAEINKFVSRNSPFSGIWENIVQQEDDLPAETRVLILEYMLPRLQRLFSEGNLPALLLPAGKEFKTRNLQPITLGKRQLRPFFELKQAKNKWECICEARQRPPFSV